MKTFSLKSERGATVNSPSCHLSSAGFVFPNAVFCRNMQEEISDMDAPQGQSLDSHIWPSFDTRTAPLLPFHPVAPAPLPLPLPAASAHGSPASFSYGTLFSSFSGEHQNTASPAPELEVQHVPAHVPSPSMLERHSHHSPAHDLSSLHVPTFDVPSFPGNGQPHVDMTFGPGKRLHVCFSGRVTVFSFAVTLTMTWQAYCHLNG